MACDNHIRQLNTATNQAGLPAGIALWAGGRNSQGHCPDCGAFLDANGVCHNQAQHARVAQAREIAGAIRDAGGHAYFFGGYVRDTLLGKSSNDLDIAVGGLTQDKLCEALSPFGAVKREVGNDYGVTKLAIYNSDGTFDQELDFPLMRRDAYTDNSNGNGYHDVKPVTGDGVTLQDDAARRDITINAIYQDVLDGEYIDPFGGMQDIIDGKIRHTTNRHFPKSNERPLRLMQIAARNPGLQIALETIELCRTMTGKFDRIPGEQLKQQFHKLLVKGKRPSIGLKVLRDTGYLPLFPALNALDGLPQDPRHHPEGDALAHTGQVCDAMATICDREGITGKENEARRFKLMLAAMLHDMGKPETTEHRPDGGIASPGHQNETQAAKAFMKQIDVPKFMRPAVLALVREHMAHISEPTPKSVRRLARRLGEVSDSENPAKNATIDDLCLLMEADMSGRTVDGSATPLGQTGNIAKIRELARNANAEAGKPKDILMGRHLIEQFGMNPKKQGREMGQLLREARLAQDDGQFTDLNGGLQWAAGRVS